MKKFLIIPILFCFLVAIINIAYGNVFVFSLWLLVTLIITMVFLPIILGTDDKNVPIYQIFIILPALFLIFSVVAIKDFMKAGQPINDAFIYGVGIGLFTIGIIMLIKGK